MLRGPGSEPSIFGDFSERMNPLAGWRAEKSSRRQLLAASYWLPADIVALDTMRLDRAGAPHRCVRLAENHHLWWNSATRAATGPSSRLVRPWPCGASGAVA